MLELAFMSGIVLSTGVVGTLAKRFTETYTIKRKMEPECKRLQRLLSKDPNSPDGGEVVVRFESGNKVPFHAHDTTIHDDTGEIEKDAADGTIWFSGRSIESVELHQESLDEL